MLLQHYFLLILLFISPRFIYTTGCPAETLPEDTTARNNTQVVLRCSNVGALFWTQNGVSISPDSEVCNCQVQPCGNLVFPSISPEDAGDRNVYTCSIFTSGVLRNSEVRICIEDLPTFQLASPAYEGTEGELLTIEISYSGTCGPLSQIDLLRDAESIINDTNIRVQVFNSKVKITYSSLRLSDQGLHTLQSENLAGEAMTTFMLLVKHEPVLSDKNISPGYTILANTTATLSCNYTGFPEVTVRWYDPNGDEITSGILISRNTQNNWIYSQLSIPMVLENEGGNYICTGINTVGNTESSITLEVTGPLESPEIIEISANEVTVSWTEPPNAYMVTRYRVEYRKHAIGSSTWHLGSEVVIGTNQTFLTDLQGFTSYLLRIIYIANEGDYVGSPIQFRTLNRAPTFPPRSPQGLTASSSAIELNWIVPELSLMDGDSQITSYRVWWGQILDNNQITYSFDTVDGSVRSYRLENLTPSSRYSIKVQAYTTGGPGPNSTQAEAATFPDTFEVPRLLLEVRREQLNWIVEWELSGDFYADIYYYVRLSDSAGEILEEIGPFSPNIRAYNFSDLDATTYYLICVEMEYIGVLQSRNCTEINLRTYEPITIALNLAIWIATPVAGVILMVCVLSALLCGLAYGCRTKREYKKSNVKKTTSDVSISSKFSMNARHPYTGEPLPQDPEAPRSCLKYHSDRGEDYHIKFPKQLRIGTDL